MSSPLCCSSGAASRICVIAAEQPGKPRTSAKNFRKFSGVTLILGGAAFLFNTILPDIEPWNVILLVAAYLACIGFVISNLCYHGSRDDKDKK